MPLGPNVVLIMSAMAIAPTKELCGGIKYAVDETTDKRTETRWCPAMQRNALTSPQPTCEHNAVLQ